MYSSKNIGYEPYTDLACERRRADCDIPGVAYRKTSAVCGIWERIEISSDAGARSIGRPIGYYDTLLLPRMDLLDKDSIEAACEELEGELTALCAKMNITPKKILTAGLGNSALTPDAIGSEAAQRIKPTRQIKKFDAKMFDMLECSEISVIKPGVAAESGLEAKDSIIGLCKRILPDAVIAIDALAARAPERLGTTIQISSTGIAPGGGLGHPCAELSEKSLGVPVIAIGVPTIMDADYFLTDDIRRAEGRGAMFVSPKEINEIVCVAAEIIAGGINRAFGIL